MFNKIKNIIYLILLVLFLFSISNYYFSEKNIIKVNKLRTNYYSKVSNAFQDLPVLENDTGNIIEYSNGIELYKKKKKNYKFWDLFKK